MSLPVIFKNNSLKESYKFAIYLSLRKGFTIAEAISFRQLKKVVYKSPISIEVGLFSLSLYGIPAVITHGNSLIVEEWSRWYTPIYVVYGWKWRKQTVIENQEKLLEESQPELVMPTPKEAIRSYEQLDLFKLYEGK